MEERVRTEGERSGEGHSDEAEGRPDVRDVQLGRADLPAGEARRPEPRSEDIRVTGGPVAAPPPTVRAEPSSANAPAPSESATLPVAASIMPGTPGGPREALPGGPREAAAGAELLLPAQRRDDLRRAWLEVQSSFIDEPQEAVRKADGLVQELLASVSERFDSARRELEGEWQRGEGVNTESLRLAFRRYRALFDRLLSF